jgi:ethanolamine utilization microcompartment shell protein EutL
MHSLQIRSTVKTASSEPHDSISRIGGVNAANIPWQLSVAEAIQVIENKQYAFYALVDNRRTDVFVARSAGGRKYLKCTADIVEGDTLASLPDCPA